ncbi:hypothetical protein Atai01_67500 [Amycolatopsis taiwanensis]|uniref:Uncharacterized protein n=1 Tax=Amycolatopsis taiwanensis TaxID=342230 RepID=A0A9W6VL40_9PSEU|nr:hypothetical protein Atai01_67500 [Amycolatopsis taiwanensis]
MVATAAYDEIADWYEEQFLSAQRLELGTPGHDPLGIGRALRDLLGDGSEICLEIDCGTGLGASARPTSPASANWPPDSHPPPVAPAPPKAGLVRFLGVCGGGTDPTVNRRPKLLNR